MDLINHLYIRKIHIPTKYNSPPVNRPPSISNIRSIINLIYYIDQHIEMGVVHLDSYVYYEQLETD